MRAAADRIRAQAEVPPEQRGARLDQVAARLFGDYSRSRLQKWILGGELTVDGRPARATLRVSGGEKLLIDAQPEHATATLPEDIPLAVIHADADLLVLNKPAGLVVHPAAGNRAGTLQNALLHYDASLAAIPRCGIVHRLDKETTGIMVVARSLRAHTSLVAQLAERSMSRIYEAVVRGELITGGIVDQPIGRHPRDRKRMAVVPSGRPAVTRYRVLQRFKGFTHLQVALQTGRTHQIRVHMAHLGHPLVGDAQYGRKSAAQRGIDPAVLAATAEFPRQALHAETLVLRHPADDGEREFHAPLPDDFRRLLAVLREAG